MNPLSEQPVYITLPHMHIQAMKSLSEATGYITFLRLHTEAMHSLDETIRSDRHDDDPDVAAILGLPRPHSSPFPGLVAAAARRALPDRPARAHGGRRHGLAMRRDPRPSPARA